MSDLIRFNDTVNIIYKDGTIEKNIAVTGWLSSELNKDIIIINGKEVEKVEKVKS